MRVVLADSRPVERSQPDQPAESGEDAELTHAAEALHDPRDEESDSQPGQNGNPSAGGVDIAKNAAQDADRVERDGRIVGVVEERRLTVDFFTRRSSLL